MQPATRSVPLRFRVPKPPQPFVGREAELARISTQLRSGNTVLVAGLAGAGKSALVRAFSHREEALLGRSIFISLMSPLAPRAALVTLARAVASATAAASVSIPEEADEEVLLESTLEMAEEAGYCIVVDNLDMVTDAGESLWLSALRHADRSIWIATTKIAPRNPDLQKQTLWLDRLPDVAMRELARTQIVRKPQVELERVIERAGGSPAEFFRLLFGSPRDAEPDRAHAWANASAGARRIAEILAIFDGPLESADLDAITGSDSAPYVEELLRRGIVSLSPQVDLDPSVRAHIGAPWLETARRGFDAAALDRVFREAGPNTRLAAIKLALAREESDRALAFTRSALEGLLDAGLASELYELLRDRIEPPFRALRLIAADTWNADAALRWAATEPRPEDLRARLAWASARAFVGEPDAALEEAKAVLRVARTPGEQSACAVLIGLVSRQRKAPAEGIAALEAAPPVDDLAEMARRNGLLGMLHALDANAEEAQAAIDRAQQDLPRVPEGKRVLVVAMVVSAYHLLGRMTRCRDVLDSARRTVPRIRTSPWWTRQSALVSLEGGDLESALRWAEAVIGANQRLRRLAMMARMVKLRVHLAHGDEAKSRAALDTLFVDTDSTENEGATWTSGVAAYAAIVLGERDAEGVPADCESHDAPGRMLWALRAMLSRRHGRAVHLSERGALGRRDGDPIDVRIIELRERAEERMLARDFAAADLYLVEAQHLARLHGWVLFEADICSLRGDAAFLRGASMAVIGAELAQALPTERYRSEAELLALVSAPTIDISAIAALAGSQVSPIAARRARAIAFGEPGRGDLLDRAFIEEARRRRHDIEATKAADEQPAALRAGRTIALDETAKQAVLGGGALRVDFKRHGQLWRLLVELVAKESCTKEDLVRAAWETDYHPLRDDGRLRVALGRLRKMLNVPFGIAIVATGESGYRLIDLAATSS